MPELEPEQVPAPEPVVGPGRPAFLATVAGGLALVIALRLLYLARFGADPGWMNGNFLGDAKAVRFGYPVEFVGMPLVRVLIFSMREAGASAAVALGSLYFVSHLLLALGIFALARTVLAPTTRNRTVTALAVALLPVFATDSGHQNISCTVAAGLYAALVALQLGGRRGGALEVGRLAALFALAAAASCCRPESALGVAVLTAAVGFAGPRLGVPRVGALATGAGLVVGVVILKATGGHSAAARGLATGSWAFYNFYDRKPYLVRLVAWLMNPHSGGSEYARYAESVRVFGSYAENGGSLWRALAHHPLQAVLWMAAKPIDGLLTTLKLDSFTPLAAVALFLIVRRVRRDGIEGWRPVLRRWLPLLSGYGAVFVFSMLWSQGLAQYLLIASPFIVLALLWGLEPWIAALSPAGAARLASGAAGAAVVALLLAGHPGRASAPVLREAGAWLQQRCAPGGCLTNALPVPLDQEVWADLQAGAPLPFKDKRAEEFVLKQYNPKFREEVRWSWRLAEARRRGWQGPIFYVRVETTSMRAFNEDFNPEHRLEGPPGDAVGGAPVVSFRDDRDAVEIFDVRAGARAP